MMRLGFTVAAAASLAACSWGIKLDSGGEKVRVAWDGNVAGCKDRGRISVSVLDHVGPVDRSGLKVRDELEVMARNQAPSLGADTVMPLGDPRDGGQDWGAYLCGPLAANAKPAMRIEQRSAAPEAGAAETYPVKDH